MKKILQRVFLSLGIIIVAIGVAAYFFLFREGGTEIVRLTVTDASGNTYLATTDADGNTDAIVVDENGTPWNVEINDDGSLGTTGSKADVDSKDVITNYSGPVIDESVDTNAYTGAPVTQQNDSSSKPAESTTTQPSEANQTTATQQTTAAQQTTQQQQTTTAPSGDSSATQTSNIIKYQQMFSSGTYYMEFTTNDEEIGDAPIVAAAKNGNILITTTMDGMNCSMLYLADKDKTYLILTDYKKYCSVPESMLGDDFDMNSFNLMDTFASDINESSIKKDKVVIDGKTLIRESYSTEDGSTMSYYFDGDTLVRLDNHGADGTNTETYISKITSDVPDSTFEIPKNYGYLNLSWLDILG